MKKIRSYKDISPVGADFFHSAIFCIKRTTQLNIVIARHVQIAVDLLENLKDCFVPRNDETLDSGVKYRALK